MTPTLQLIDGAPGAARFAFDSFASLIAPLGSDAFFNHYWERQPFHVRRGRPGYFDALFGMADVDRLIGSQLFRDGDVRIAKDGALTPFAEFSRGGVANRAAMLQAYANGATLVFEHLNRHHAGLGRAMACCEVELEFPIRVNSYLTPARSKGFSRHYDTHDVLVLQVSGSKTWQIYDNPLPLPHEEQAYVPAWGEQARLLAEITLQPGDVLYLPRGFIHGASANGDSSLHLTIGMRSLPLREVAVSAIRHAALAHPQLRQAARFRGIDRGAVLEQARRQLHALVDEADLGALFDDVLYSFIKKRTRPMDGQLLELGAAPSIDHQTPLALRPGCLARSFARAGGVALAVDGRTIRLPAGVEAALGFIGTRPVFCAAQLPGLEYESRLILARTLHAEGVLEVRVTPASPIPAAPAVMPAPASAATVTANTEHPEGAYA